MVQDNFDYKKKFSEICSKFDLKISAERELNVDRNLLGELANSPSKFLSTLSSLSAEIFRSNFEQISENFFL